jgi:hypothetical protein
MIADQHQHEADGHCLAETPHQMVKAKEIEK